MGIRSSQVPGGALQRKYDILRNRAQQGGQAQEQEQVGALQRRFAALGNLSSGAAIKQEQLVKEQAAKQREEAVQNVDVAQAGEEAQQEQIKQQQEFAAKEREAAQQFGAGEAEKQRGFQKSIADRDADFREKVFGQETQFKQKELDMASEELKINKEVTAFNAFAQALESKDPGALAGAMQNLNKVLGTNYKMGGKGGKGGSSGDYGDALKNAVAAGTKDEHGNDRYRDKTTGRFFTIVNGQRVYR